MSDDRQLAIIRRPHFGVGDRGSVALWFEVYLTESSAALQVFGVPDAVDIITAYGVKDIRDLDGRPCWVTVTPGCIAWAGAWKI